jgi:hypothetical protein
LVENAQDNIIKKDKPDFEAIALKGTDLVLLGSGSTENRNLIFNYAIPTGKIQKNWKRAKWETTTQTKRLAAIAKIVIGQTATTEGTPGRLGSDKTQADVAQKIVEADSDLLCGGFNAGPVKWWTEWNFPGAVPPKVYRHTAPPEDLNSRACRSFSPSR